MPNFYSPKEDLIPEQLKSDLRTAFRKQLEHAFIALYNQEKQQRTLPSVHPNLRSLDGRQLLLCAAILSPSSRREVVGFMIDVLFDDRKDEFMETKKKELRSAETLILFLSVLKAMSLVIGNANHNHNQNHDHNPTHRLNTYRNPDHNAHPVPLRPQSDEPCHR